MPIDDQTTVADYLVLGTWEALTLLGEARELCDADDVAELTPCLLGEIKADQGVVVYIFPCVSSIIPVNPPQIVVRSVGEISGRETMRCRSTG